MQIDRYSMDWNPARTVWECLSVIILKSRAATGLHFGVLKQVARWDKMWGFSYNNDSTNLGTVPSDS